MFKHHTKDKGDLGVLKAQADMGEQGYLIMFPMTEHAPFDLVIYKDFKFKRVQVRHRAVSKFGTMNVAFYSVWSDKRGVHVKPMNKEEIDVICVYCPNTKECYYFDPAKHGKSISIRVHPSKNNQKKHVLCASDYRNVP
jgi:hypothetical protein